VQESNGMPHSCLRVFRPAGGDGPQRLPRPAVAAGALHLCSPSAH